MGIRLSCPNGHRLNVKEFLAGKRGICPQCGAKFIIPVAQSTTEMMSAFAGARENVEVLSSSEPGAQSIIIAVADSPTGESIEPPPVTLQPVGQTPVTTSSVDGAGPIIVTRTVNPSRPATGYELRRERNRRNQVTLAIVLLLAVAILAVVLIVVLQNGSQQPAAPAAESAKVSSMEWIPHLVQASRVT
jgi:hypothetical protein